MFVAASIVAILTVAPADLIGLSQGATALPRLTSGAGVRVVGRLALNSPFLDAAERDGQRRRHNNSTSTDSTSSDSQSTGSTDTERPSSGDAATSGTSAAETGSTASSAPAEEEPDIELIRHREHLTRMHKPLGLATWASLLITEIAGTILAINQQTVFGPGSCNLPTSDGSNPCLLGDFGGPRGPLNAFHELSAFITVGFYAATGLYAVAMPDPEHASTGNDERASHLRVHKALAWVHMIGMVLLPILGVLSVEPGLVGLNIDTSSPGSIMRTMQTIDNYQADMRTVHLSIGYVTFAALTVAMLYELVF